MAMEQLIRNESEYVPLYQRFIIKEKSFSQQFSHIYNQRLLGLRPSLEKVFCFLKNLKLKKIKIDLS